VIWSEVGGSPVQTAPTSATEEEIYTRDSAVRVQIREIGSLDVKPHGASGRPAAVLNKPD